MPGFGTAHQNITTGANFIPEVWSKELQVATESNLVAAKLVKRFDAELKAFGDVLHIPKISNLAANAKVTETAVTFQSPTEGKVDLTINKHYEVSFLIERMLDDQSKYTLQNEYKQRQSYALAKQIDTDVLALQSGLSQSEGSDNVALGDSNLLRGIQYLDDADAPEGDRSMIVSPATKMDLIQIQRLSSADFVGDKPVMKGFFGERYGVNFFVSTNVPTGTSGHINVLIHKEALACALQRNITMYSDFIIEHISDAYVADVLYGVIEYRDAFGVKMLGK
jgi:hypothetical protein